MANVILRAVIFYILLTLMMKLMGKRQLGEMEISELVTTVLLSELASFTITDTDIPIFHGLFPVLLISSFEVAISFISQRSKKFSKLLNGNAIILFNNGDFIVKNLEKTRVSAEDIEAEVRINGLENMSEVKRVILERNGKMSVLPKDSGN